MVSMQKRPTDWSPIKALGTASQYVDSLMVPGLSVNLDDKEHLEFSDLMNASNRDLSEFSGLWRIQSFLRKSDC